MLGENTIVKSQRVIGLRKGSRGIMGRIWGGQSRFSRNEGILPQCINPNGAAEVKVAPTLSEKSQAGAEVTKVSQE
ncbi:unnamed protein product [Pleuronectes platessa]|uniref:Uncharacterized protein n=1 Tax=Pleuronectes platessa TaxID=8262 RepID=A0A9N7Z0N1_PLEPL|nr:unnamed protein product [Pleuronectes platessa]